MKIALYCALFASISLLGANSDEFQYTLSKNAAYQQEGYDSDKITLLLYRDQGDSNFVKQEYREALRNYQSVISYLRDRQLHDPSNLLNAICGSMFCHDMLNEDQFAKKAFDELVYQVAVLQKDVEKVGWFQESAIYEIYQQNPNRYPARIQKIDLPDLTPEEHCQLQCNGYSLAAAFACGKVPHSAIQALCYGCLFGLEQLCVRCCKGEGFGKIVLRV